MYPIIIYFVIFILSVILSFGIIRSEKHGIVVNKLFINPAFIGPFSPYSNIGFMLYKWISFFNENIDNRNRKITIIINIELILDTISISLFNVKNIVIPSTIII